MDRAKYRIVSVLFLAQLGISAIFAFWYSRLLDLPSSGLRVAFHVSNVAALLAILGLLWLTCAGPTKRNHHPLRLLHNSVVFTFLLALNLLYAIELLSTSIYYSSLTRSTVIAMQSQAPGIFQNIGPRGRQRIELVAILFPLILILLIIFSRRVWWAFCEGKKVRKFRLTIITIAIVALLFSGLFELVARNIPLWRSADPFQALFIMRFTPPLRAVRDLSRDRIAEAAYRRADPAIGKPNVILVIFDDIRADHLACFGYARATTPYLSRLLASFSPAPICLSAFAVGNASEACVPGIIASRDSSELQIGNFNLFGALSAQGYHTRMVGSGDHLRFLQMRELYGPHLDFFRDGNNGPFTAADDRNVVQAVEGLPDDDGSPSLLVLHFMSAHVLGIRQPECARWAPASWNQLIPPFWEGNKARLKTTDIYDNGILQADIYFGRCFEQLRAKGYLRNYVFAITSDHGESIGDRGVFGHGKTLYQSELAVPLIFFGSSMPKILTTRLVGQVDIAPTLLDLAGLPIPSCWQGVSLLRPPTTRSVFFSEGMRGSWCGLAEWRNGTLYKYLHDTRKRATRGERLFGLSHDPAETNDLSAKEAVLTHELSDRLDKHFATNVREAR